VARYHHFPRVQPVATVTLRPMSRAVKIFQGRFGRVALLDMNASLVAHAHHHCHILIKAGGQDSAFSVRGQKQPLTDETAVLINAWEPHAYTHAPAPSGQTLILALYIEPPWLSEIQQSLALSAHPRFFPQACVHIKPATRKIVEEFVLELWLADEMAASRLETLLFNLVIAVIDSYSGWRDMAGLLRTRPPTAIDPRTRKVIRHMRDNLSRDFDMDDLATHAGLSRSHFFSLFHRDTQVTPLVYANVLRFEAAVDRLSQSSAPVGDVSHDLGFSAAGHFARFFRQHLGITPTDYRRAVNLYMPPIGDAPTAPPI
jgi:AraC family transcriptional regulator